MIAMKTSSRGCYTRKMEIIAAIKEVEEYVGLAKREGSVFLGTTKRLFWATAKKKK